MMKGKSPYQYRRRAANKRVRKDYQRKSLSNPFFQQRRPQKDRQRRGHGLQTIRTVGFIAVAAVLAYVIFISPLFALKQIEVLGINRIDPESLSAIAWKQADERSVWPFRQHNLMFFKTDELSQKLTDGYSFDSLRVYKKWPHRVIISAGERNLAFVWRNKEGQYFSDSHGCLIREAAVTPADLTNYPVLEAADSQDRLNEKDCLVVDGSYLRAMFQLADKMKSYPELKVDRFLLENEANTLKADLNLGPNILFNVKEEPEKQLNKLIIIKADKQSAEFNRLEYIDLRYGDRAYFK